MSITAMLHSGWQLYGTMGCAVHAVDGGHTFYQAMMSFETVTIPVEAPVDDKH